MFFIHDLKKGVQHVCGFCKSNIQGIHMECDDIRYHVKVRINFILLVNQYINKNLS